MKFSQHFSFFLVLILAAFLLQSCSNNDFRVNFNDAPVPYNTSQAIGDTTVAGGIHIFVLKKGEGPFQVVSKDIIDLKYTGRKEDGKIFASSFNSANPNLDFLNTFTNLTPYPISNIPPLVEGFRKGLIGMKEGEKRTIIVPPSMGYNEEFRQLTGQTGSPQTRLDLRGETLTYDVELVEIKNTH